MATADVDEVLWSTYPPFPVASIWTAVNSLCFMLVGKPELSNRGDIILVVGGVAGTRRGFREQGLYCQVSPFIFPVLEPIPSCDGGVWKQPQVPSTFADGHGFGVRAQTARPGLSSHSALDDTRFTPAIDGVFSIASVHHSRVASERFRDPETLMMWMALVGSHDA